MLAGAYLFPPLHDIRHLPAGDSKPHILLCKESTSRMISEEIYLYMIGLYFHKLNQLSYDFEFQSFLRTVMTQYFLFQNLGVKHFSLNYASKLFTIEFKCVGFFMAKFG